MEMKLTVEYLPIDAIAPNPGNARSHSPEQVTQIARSIKRFGLINPLVVDANNLVRAGHGRLLAAKSLGLAKVPVLRLAHLGEAELRAYSLADNKIAENAEWDRTLLRVELSFLMEADIDFDVDLTGFSVTEIDLATQPEDSAQDDPIPEPPAPEAAVTWPGDIWQVGKHRIACCDCRDDAATKALLADEQAQMVFQDPPYNVRVDGHVCGLGKAQHAEFAFASGEMSVEVFTDFLRSSIEAALARCVEGALAYICMDWRHLPELHAACSALELAPVNLAVWIKNNAGMGSFYRSQHELVFVVKKGKAPHINNVELGANGRYRSNVWEYPGMNSFSPDRDELLAMHPTVKPVALVADAIMDATKHGDLVLDFFLGSGTTLLAAERTKRRCFGIEIEPRYVDVALQRWIALTGKQPVLAATGETFAMVRAKRTGIAEV